MICSFLNRKEKTVVISSCSLHNHLTEPSLYLLLTQALLISPINNEITASTNKMCIIPPALYIKNPSNQPITKITAMI